MKQSKMARMKLADMVPAEYNPREITDRALEGLGNSIERFGLVQPIVWNERSGRIVGGHQRHKVMTAKGVTETDVVVVDLDENEEMALNVALNNPEIQGDWDGDKIDDILRAIHKDSGDIFKDTRMDDLAEKLKVSLTEQSKKDANDVPPLPKEAVSETGKVYVLGTHRLICGDSTKADVVAKLMGEIKADLMLTDPPYNVAYVGGTKDELTIQNDSMPEESFIAFLSDALKAADVVMRAGAAFYIWHACVETYSNFVACRNAGWKVRQVLVWVKDRLVLGRKDYHFRHEPCLYGWKQCGEGFQCAQPSFDEVHEGALYGWKEGSHMWLGGRKQTTVLEFDRPHASADHPTMKPVELFEQLVWNNTRRGGVVLDLFCGSGTTVIVAEKSGRVAYGVELDPAYCDVIRRRWAEYVNGEGCDWQKLTPEVSL